jgi:hypothetical protein
VLLLTAGNKVLDVSGRDDIVAGVHVQELEDLVGRVLVQAVRDQRADENYFYEKTNE